MRYLCFLIGSKYSFILSYTSSRGLRGHFEWRDKIDNSSRNFVANETNFAFSTEPADGLTLLEAMISAGEVQTSFWSFYMYIYMSGPCDSSRDGALRVSL